MLSSLSNYKTTKYASFTTVTDTMPGVIPTNQYYPYPEGEVTLEGVVVTVNGVNFPLQIVNSEYEWEKLNAIQFQPSSVPQFYFPRADDFGIWPSPQQVYTGSIVYHYRDRNLSINDYSTGSIQVSANSTSIVGNGTTFTPAMVGRWFSITDPTAAGQGYWYRIGAYVSPSALTLSWPYKGSSGSGYAYIIGESPEIPEEGHMTLVDGVTAAFYNHMRKDTTEGARFDNLFWTGDPANSKRQIGNSEIAGGLIGLMNRYATRDNSKIINRRPKFNPWHFKEWATVIS